MAKTILRVDVKICPESSDYLCTSEDIPGVFLETETLEEMKQEIEWVVPDLAKNNLKLTDEELSNVAFLLTIHESKETSKTKQPRFYEVPEEVSALVAAHM